MTIELVTIPTIPIHNRTLNHILSASRWELNSAPIHATSWSVTPMKATIRDRARRATDAPV